jgi:hypothetical protein
MPLEVHALMHNSDNNDPALGGPNEQNVRADQELSIAGADVVAGAPSARIACDSFRGALNVA